jgi:hypothetical protein
MEGRWGKGAPGKMQRQNETQLVLRTTADEIMHGTRQKRVLTRGRECDFISRQERLAWGCSTVVACVPSRCKALNLSSSTKRKNKILSKQGI